MGLFSKSIEPGESAGDYIWRQDLDDATNAVCRAADAKKRGAYEEAADRLNQAEVYLGHTERSRKRG